MPTRALFASTSQLLRRLALSGAGWALGLVALGGCDAWGTDEPAGLKFPYEIVVEDFRSPCPSRCSVLPFDEYDNIGYVISSHNYNDRRVLGERDWEDERLTFFGPFPSHEATRWRPTCGNKTECDCQIQFQVTVRPTVYPNLLRMVSSSAESQEDPLLHFTPSAEDDGWNFELIGEFPMPLPASDYDPSYEQQEFHLVGYPDEYIEADPESCTDDLRSLRFDLRLTPLLPYHMQ